MQTPAQSKRVLQGVLGNISHCLWPIWVRSGPIDKTNIIIGPVRFVLTRVHRASFANQSLQVSRQVRNVCHIAFQTKWLRGYAALRFYPPLCLILCWAKADHISWHSNSFIQELRAVSSQTMSWWRWLLLWLVVQLDHRMVSVSSVRVNQVVLQHICIEGL